MTPVRFNGRHPAARTLAVLAGALLVSCGARPPVAARAAAAEALPVPRYVAHAGGAVRGLTVTNSLEALDAGYARGFRFFELDFEWTSDRRLVLIHDWDHRFGQLYPTLEGRPTGEQFVAARMVEGLTPLSLEGLLEWLAAHPDAHVITDVKSRNAIALSLIRDRAGVLRERFIPQVFSFSEYDQARKYGFPRIVLGVYRLRVRDASLDRFLEKARLWAVSLPHELAESDLLARFRARKIPVLVHTINDDATRRALERRGVAGVYTDSLFEP